MISVLGLHEPAGEARSGMVIEELTYVECHSMLARAHLARLACAVDNQPYIVPIHVDFADGALYGYSPMGQKIDWMRVNPLVCLEIEEFDAQVGWATLLVFGQYEELPDIPEFAPARHLAERLFQRHPVWWEPASVPIAGQPRRRPVLFRILITRLTGRRGVRTPEGGDRPGDQIAANDPSNGWLKRAVRRLSKR